MALLKMKLTPTAAGYSATPGATFLATKLDGGQSRFRQDIIGAAAAVNVAWATRDAASYDYLQAFYRQTGAKGLPFLIDLILDGSALAEYTAHFLGAPTFNGKDGSSYSVSAQLEVVPLAVNDTADLAAIAAFTAPA